MHLPNDSARERIEKLGNLLSLTIMGIMGIGCLLLVHLLAHCRPVQVDAPMPEFLARDYYDH